MSVGGRGTKLGVSYSLMDYTLSGFIISLTRSAG